MDRPSTRPRTKLRARHRKYQHAGLRTRSSRTGHPGVEHLKIVTVDHQSKLWNSGTASGILASRSIDVRFECTSKINGTLGSVFIQIHAVTAETMAIADRIVRSKPVVSSCYASPVLSRQNRRSNLRWLQESEITSTFRRRNPRLGKLMRGVCYRNYRWLRGPERAERCKLCRLR